MPVAERPAHNRDKILSKCREKPKLGRLLELLVYVMLFTLTTDAAYLMFDCMHNCPVPRTCSDAADHEENKQKMTISAENLKPTAVIGSLLDLYQLFELDDIAAESNQDDGILTQDVTEADLIPKELLDGVDWDDRGEDADPTRKKNMKYEDFSVYIASVLRDFALYNDQDALDIQFPDDIAYIHKAMFDSSVFKSSF